ncbi:methylenetetrahydrofolate reductase [Ahrensia sp. R2A130]|uniref:methylenetetrahydrofolate reductase n=1 Tax=Ahrensia sp. R2A130 TaxID=744979 RepID=UPI0001E0B47E|nr:methylenetetrahydrofolate reductase [Ahrensia sp. R2A130]EFL90716.1 methylenetetrahydrofolate reductase [Ahrensia sp. R2A130]
MTNDHMSHIPASMEVSAKHVHDGKLTAGMLPSGTRVYITDVGVDPVEDLIRAAATVRGLGYSPVPHVPARRIESEAALDARIAGLVNEGGVDDILIIAGEAPSQMGPYSQSLDILQTGVADRRGVNFIAVGGHPEGNPAYLGVDVMNVLRDKLAFGAQSDAEFRIVTQFGFDGKKFIDWAKALKADGIDTPIHLGVAGPAKITTLIKYAAMCGVGNSLNFFKKRTGAIAMLATKHSPEEVVSPIEQAWLSGETNITQMHVFPFGGLQASADWLHERGSYQTAPLGQAHA